jgi:hypothetical protein
MMMVWHSGFWMHAVMTGVCILYIDRRVWLLLGSLDDSFVILLSMYGCPDGRGGCYRWTKIMLGEPAFFGLALRFKRRWRWEEDGS